MELNCWELCKIKSLCHLFCFSPFCSHKETFNALHLHKVYSSRVSKVFMLPYYLRSAATKSMFMPRGKCWGWVQKVCQGRYHTDLLGSGPADSPLPSPGGAWPHGGLPWFFTYLACFLWEVGAVSIPVLLHESNYKHNEQFRAFLVEYLLIKNKCSIPITSQNTEGETWIPCLHLRSPTTLTTEEGRREGPHRACHT